MAITGMLRELALDGCEDGVDGQFFHAAVMQQRAVSLLAGAAVEFQLQVLGFVVAGFAPGDVSWTEEGNDGLVECRSEVPGSRVGGDQQFGFTDRGFGETNAQLGIHQAEDCGMVRGLSDPASVVAFGGAANDQDGLLQIGGDSASEFRKVFPGPVLRGSECATGI